MDSHDFHGTEIKLGKLAPKLDGALKLASYVTADLPKPPAKVDWSVKVPSFPMYANDKLGDCTCAAVGHMVQVWTYANGNGVTPDVADVTNMYWATGKQDTGRVEADILRFWLNKGFGAYPHIDAFVQVNPHNHTEVKQAVDLFGGLYIGIALPISAQSQSTWRVVRGPESEPGSWGGHAVNVVGYDHGYLTVITWGQKMRMTWAFWNKYVDEAWAVLSPQWAGTTSPVGFNLTALEDDLHNL